MSRRKNSSPAKLSQTGLTSWNFSLRGDTLLSTKSPSSVKKVCFDIPVVNDASENFDTSIKYRRKKLFKTSPTNGVVLGEINFFVRSHEKINSNLGDVDYCILVNETKDYLEVILKICLDKNTSTFCEVILPNEKLVKNFSDLLQHQYIWVIENPVSLGRGKLNVHICTTPEKTPILKATNLIDLFFGDICKTYMEEKFSPKKICSKEFFKELQHHQRGELHFIEESVQHEKLLPKLCPYQARAVQWMLFRENEDLQAQTTDWLSTVVEIYKSKCDKNLYFNKYSGVMSLDLCNFPLLPKGGILADEMGLGKTVAVISLILNHNRDLNDETETFLSPLARTDQRKVLESDPTLKSVNDDIRVKNKESHMSADEKLIYNKVSRGPALKRALTEWYESKLAEYCAVTPSKVRRVSGNTVKCICGSTSFKSRQECVQCPECEQFQHSKCVGFEKNFLYFCPSCWTKQKLVKSNCTLIIAPTSIYHQWFDEIKKHVAPGTFKNGVFMYDGLKSGFIQPSVLSVNDIVITTYAILRAEVNYAMQNDSGPTLRNEKRFLKMCSPLSQIHWWRLCLDEAQMVENDYSQLNQMANIISSVNRWSVTGTPIQKSISDLYYLIEWLGVEPFGEKAIWNNLLYIPYMNGNKIPLYSVMSKVFWRNSKEDVTDELIIPKQTVTYHFLKFTAIEQNFYMREHAVSSADFSECLRRLRLDVTKTIDSIDKTTLTKLLIPLLNLRQACSHPLAVKGNKISRKTGSMTLSELLQYLFNKTKLECEEGMRKYVAALNGLAGLYCIQEEWAKAVEHYRQVLQFTQEYKEKIHIDSLQRIHTLTNLAEILQHHSDGIPPTLRDDSLKDDAKALEDKYMQKAIDDLKADENLLIDLSKKVLELEQKFESASDVWWNRLIHILSIDGSVEELLDKIAAELTTSEVENKKKVELFLSKISSVRGVEIMLRNWLSVVDDNRKKALKHLDILRKTPCDDLVYHAVDCHLRTFGVEGKRKKCQLCSCESVLLDYECSLFDVSRKVLKEEYEKVLDGAQTKGSWRSQNAEKCLKVLLNISKQKNTCEAWCLKDGKTHIQLLEVMKKEFKQLRAVWMSINHQVQACDEISMCKLRLRLRLPGEPIPPKMTSLSLKEHNKVESIYIIEHHEMEPQRLKLIGELEVSKSEFKKKYGTLLYLNNLGQKENPKPEPCPVCKTVLENEWCVLQCGHSYCIDCIRIMLNRSPKASLSCPVCREITKSCDLSFIDLSGKQDNSDVNVLGDHSTKVEGIVRTLLELKKSDPKVKVLVFSTWGVVLKILEVALNQNSISFRRMPGHKYQLHLKEFRDPNSDITALLLPISWGSKGLNLTEASHVFLVEPIMNPAEELQAIGRVHRIGQTKETVVHRFLIRGTIEEKIHAAVSEAKDKWGQKKVTLEDLKNLFDMKNELVTSIVMLCMRYLYCRSLFNSLAVKRMDIARRPSSNLSEFREIFKKAKNIVILTGAGVSAESGIPTFRGPGGYWRKYQAQDLATPQAFKANPSLVWEFYHHRREVALSKEPNNAHRAIADCQNRLREENRKVWIITQNIDGLHQRAGAKEVIELHGSLFKTRCLKCRCVEENRDSPICAALAGKGAPDPQTMSADIPEKELPRCNRESCKGLLRPHIVWFGEMLEPEVLSMTEEAVLECDLCLVVGTSSVVFPAAMFAPQVAHRGVPVAEFNVETTPATGDFRFHFDGPCGLTIPQALAP